jgi:hypothetical protein
MEEFIDIILIIHTGIGKSYSRFIPLRKSLPATPSVSLDIPKYALKHTRLFSHQKEGYHETESATLCSRGRSVQIIQYRIPSIVLITTQSKQVCQ